MLQPRRRLALRGEGLFAGQLRLAQALARLDQLAAAAAVEFHHLFHHPDQAGHLADVAVVHRELHRVAVALQRRDHRIAHHPLAHRTDADLARIGHALPVADQLAQPAAVVDRRGHAQRETGGAGLAAGVAVVLRAAQAKSAAQADTGFGRGRCLRQIEARRAAAVLRAADIGALRHGLAGQRGELVQGVFRCWRGRGCCVGGRGRWFRRWIVATRCRPGRAAEQHRQGQDQRQADGETGGADRQHGTAHQGR
ncbi:hypothetical protein [uncultured Sphaerotilus sp.]|uniref:hypothetical protein n=1 Tax=uncultured Sphaerotilus sp. TaxID=474984 RepID=UPI0030CA4BDA